MRSRRPRGLIFGNLLIMLGVALLGATVNVTSAGGAGFADYTAIAPPDSVALVEATPATEPAPPAATATPTAVPPSPTATPSPVSAAISAPAPAATPQATPLATPPIIQPAVTPTPAPLATPETTPKPSLPPATHISIPSVGIDTKVVEVGYDLVTIQGQRVIQWQVADYAAGHNELSANPGEGGNIVITGHDDWRGEVFRNLNKVKLGDQITVATSKGEHHYAVTEIEYRLETGAPLSERLATGMFLAPMPEERLTLVTCWPYGVDDHRLIVIAKPIG